MSEGLVLTSITYIHASFSMLNQELVFVQVLRLVMFLGKQRRQRGLKTAGGLLVLLWTETGASAQSLNCTGKI